MEVTFDILRRRSAAEKPFIQTVTIDGGRCATVAEALDLINAEELADDPIQWERSCKQKKCGACAMLINGRPRLACDTKLSEFRKRRIELAPLKKFPVVRDLIVDRKVIFDDLQKLGAWLDENAEADISGISYEASRCLQCGCCLEVCPNFYPAGNFYGASVLSVSSRLAAETPAEYSKRIYGAYNEHFYRGCGKSLSCKDICPAGIDTERLMVNSNAAAVWKRGKRKKTGSKQY